MRRVLKSYASYYNRVRTHLSLKKNDPLFRRRQTVGNIVSIPIWVGCTINMFELRFSVGTAHRMPLGARDAHKLTAPKAKPSASGANDIPGQDWISDLVRFR